MINLRAIRIDQSYSLEDGESQNFLVMEMPDGTELRTLINEDQTTQIITASVNGNAPWSEKTVQGKGAISTRGLQQVQTVGGQSDHQDASNAQALFEDLTSDDEGPSEGELINWGSLPNDVLTVTMKAAFKMLGAATQLKYEDIQQLANNVAESFGPEEWAKVQAQITSAPQAKSHARPPIGQVQWADGSPMVAGTVPSRTVPKDDAGYPIITGEIDPGEVVAGGDTDEDGVGQL